MQRRCNRNRKRSQRRKIYCPIHGCYLDSVSQKFYLYADTPGQLQARGVSSRNARMLLAQQQAIPLSDEWLEAFWCQECHQKTWYRIRKRNHIYEVSSVPPEIWQQVTGVIYPDHNPSVSEFTQRQVKKLGYHTSKDFR
ncbi:hypothetical protein [Calothrix sp. UHCC 0171]|uniref:hypothetical protein n=1 Tax=Calothrix sp. UHCC 0171 TaxID=3110245 RepID=UPI002B20D893|nr:hypothetical protein [Calothrix sp. UHCC 0171]MEA5573967.1 hypothetical protein [Calothrix sp. UHCC 0171]